jgi:hypothetical protein
MTDETSEAQFASRALSRLPAATPAPGFEAALLAAYDGWQARRSAGLAAAVGGAVRGFFDLVWPGAPLWAPAGAFAASLLVGAILGASLPTLGEERTAFSLDRPPGFSLLSTDLEEDL